MNNNEYLIEVKIKNNALFQLMRERGINSLLALSKVCGVSLNSLSNIANLKMPLFGSGRVRAGFVIRKPYRDLARFFGVDPEVLCPDDLHYQGLKENKVEKEIAAAEIMQIMNESDNSPDGLIENKQFKSIISDALSTLTPREEKVLKWRIFDELTFDQCAKKDGVTRERIRQIEQKALRKLRHPNRSAQLREFIEP